MVDHSLKLHSPIDKTDFHFYNMNERSFIEQK